MIQIFIYLEKYLEMSVKSHIDKIKKKLGNNLKTYYLAFKDKNIQ